MNLVILSLSSSSFDPSWVLYFHPYLSYQQGLGFEPQHIWLLLFSFLFPIKKIHPRVFQKWETYHDHIHLKQTCPKMYGTLSQLSTLAHPHAPNLMMVVGQFFKLEIFITYLTTISIFLLCTREFIFKIIPQDMFMLWYRLIEASHISFTFFLYFLWGIKWSFI